MGRTTGQLDETIARFRESFWERRGRGRPPLGVVRPDLFLPIRYLRRPFLRSHVIPQEVDAALAKSDYEFAFADKPLQADDFLPFSAVWRAVPWLEACCGCEVRYASGSLAPEPRIASLEGLSTVAIPASADWLGTLKENTRHLAATAEDDCWISPTILRGNSDVLAALRGLSNLYCDLYDGPEILDAAAARVNRLMAEILKMHFDLVQPKYGGYGHIYGYWSPGKTIVLQEDVLGSCSPAIYRDLFRHHNADLVRLLGDHVLFHLHSTGYRHYRDVLDIPGIAGLEITVEANGPSLDDMTPVFREILERSRLILFVDHGFSQLADVLRKLPRTGLYVVVRDDDIATDRQFHEFVATVW